MYVAMNTFTIDDSRREEFEEVWTNRERHLDEMDGFVSFQLLRGKEEEGKRDYISHSSWRDEAAFLAWTESEQFRKAHQNARTPEGIIQGRPRFNGFEVILNQ